MDASWKSYGIGAEIIALISENISDVSVKRVSLPDLPAPAASNLEKQYYINKEDIKKAIKEL